MLNQNLFAFLAVVETGSFTLAAEKMQTSKARVSQQVSKLEAELGITLLHRSTRTIHLTDAGESFYNESCRAANILQQAQKQIQDEQDNLAGQIKLNSVGGLFAEQLLTPAIIHFMQQHPDIEIIIDLTSHQVDVMAESFDLVIRMGKLNDSSLIGRQLMALKTYAVASPLYLKQYGIPSLPHELAHHNCLCGSIKHWQFINKDNDKQEVTVDGSLKSANGHILHAAAIAGLGIVRLNELYLKADLANGQLLPVLKNWHIQSQPVSLIYPKVRYKTKRIQVFVEFLVTWFEQNI